MVFLFVGQDNLSKDIRLKKIKEEFLPKGVEDFNLDTLYARELDLKALQERFLSLPIKGKKRIIVIKDAQDLKEESQEFIRDFVKSPAYEIILILDIDRRNPRDKFVNEMSRFGKLIIFKETPNADAFSLGRQIDRKDADSALRLLNELLDNGERPEMILGGLRYASERSALNSKELSRRMKLLLSCDIDIKTGRLKPDFALERLVIRLCALTKPQG